MNILRNRVQLIGFVGNRPEMVNLGLGKKLAKLSLATNESFKNAKGETIEDTQWHNLIAWGKTAEIIEKYLKKGTEVVIEGKLNYQTYDDKEGNRRYTTQVVVQQILLLGKK